MLDDADPTTPYQSRIEFLGLLAAAIAFHGDELCKRDKLRGVMERASNSAKWKSQNSIIGTTEDHCDLKSSGRNVQSQNLDRAHRIMYFWVLSKMMAYLSVTRFTGLLWRVSLLASRVCCVDANEEPNVGSHTTARNPNVQKMARNFWPHPSSPLSLLLPHEHQIQNWLAQIGGSKIGQIRMNRARLAKVGPFPPSRRLQKLCFSKN